jgi:hypothetical protein
MFASNVSDAEKSDDFYSGLMENNVWKVTSVVYAILTAPIGSTLVYGIIWFERFGSDSKRTLINLMVSSGSAFPVWRMLLKSFTAARLL